MLFRSLAMHASVCAAAGLEQHLGREVTVLCPGLGTLTGRMSPTEAAAQMALAVRHNREPAESTWEYADKRFMEVNRLYRR